MKKKIVSCLLVASMVAGMFVGCGDSKEEASNQDQETVSQEEQKETTEEGEQTEGETEQKETELSMFIDFTWFLYAQIWIVSEMLLTDLDEVHAIWHTVLQ